MTKKIPAILFALFVIPVLTFALPAKKTARKKIHTPEPKSKSEIVKPLTASDADSKKRSFFDKVVSRLVISFDSGPMILLPVMDSSKDLGPNYGIMPIWALRDSSGKVIQSVIAPSVNYNRYLRTTYTYRHYVFPDDKKLLVARGSYSTVVQREVFLHYFDPELLGSRFRVNAEVRHWINGKASFYGYGPDSMQRNQASYALNMTGEEFTLDMPLFSDFFLDFTHSFYSYRVGRGPVVTLPQVKEAFPCEYTTASETKNHSIHKMALIFDDTDHPVLPRIGTYASLSAAFSRKALGSDYNYQTYTALLKHYYNHKEEGKYITAVHYLIQKQTGNRTPFYAQPVLGEGTGLRAVGDGRFVDRGKMVINIEERIRLSRSPLLKFFSELELSPFLDMGTVFENPSAMRLDKFKLGPGVSFRIVIRPQVVGTADLAFGNEGTNAIIKVGYPF
ncbi:MAG: BamA/TamA family outer membrane protein [bacterium]